MNKTLKRCVKCNSSQLYTRIRKKQIVCKRCGYITSLQTLENTNGENQKKENHTKEKREGIKWTSTQ